MQAFARKVRGDEVRSRNRDEKPHPKIAQSAILGWRPAVKETRTSRLGRSWRGLCGLSGLVRRLPFLLFDASVWPWPRAGALRLCGIDRTSRRRERGSRGLSTTCRWGILVGHVAQGFVSLDFLRQSLVVARFISQRTSAVFLRAPSRLKDMTCNQEQTLLTVRRHRTPPSSPRKFNLSLPISGCVLLTRSLDTIEGQASVPRDVFPPTPPGPEGSNGNGLFRVQWSPVPGFFSIAGHRVIGPSGETPRTAGGRRRYNSRPALPLIMTKRLYYDQPDLLEFDSVVEEISTPRSARRKTRVRR